MSFCGNCGAALRHGVDECPECNAPTRARDRKNQAGPADRNQRDEERLRCADYERKKYQLEPRQDHETIHAYVIRIDEEKTPFILAEHKQLLENLNRSQSAKQLNNLEPPAIQREPGSDDEPEVHNEQAA